MRKILVVTLCALLTGCAAAPKMLWVRTDGQRSSQNPVLVTQYEIDSTACMGERSKANLSGVTVSQGGIAGMAAAIDRSNAADSVQRGCMAEKGYLLVPEDQAEAKQADLAVVAEAKRKQEAAAAAPAAVSRKPAPKRPAGPAT